MDKKLAHIVRTAWERKILMGSFVDFQVGCYNKTIDDAWAHGRETVSVGAFKQGRVFADGLRKRGVELAHFMHVGPGREDMANSRLVFDRAAALAGRYRFQSVWPRKGETVFPKRRGNGLTNQAAVEHFRKNAPGGVFTCAGVYSDICLEGTILGIFDAVADCNVIVATDATDLEVSPKAYIEQIRRRLPPEKRPRLHGATSMEILAALDAAALDIAMAA